MSLDGSRTAAIGLIARMGAILMPLDESRTTAIGRVIRMGGILMAFHGSRTTAIEPRMRILCHSMVVVQRQLSDGS